MKRRTLVKLLGCTAVAGIVVVFCFFAFVWYIFGGAEDIEDWFAVMQTSRGLPAAQARFDELYSRIFTISDDALLEERLTQPYVPDHSYTYCIRAGAGRVYGTERPYTAVLADYSRQFEAKGWECRGSDIFPEIMFCAIDDTAHMLIRPLDAEEMAEHPEWRKFQTVYLLGFDYAEPKLLVCAG